MIRPRSRSSIRRMPDIRPMFAGMRRFDRKDARVQVLVIDERGWEIPFESINISQSGVFVGSSYLYNVGDVHTLVIVQGAQCVRLEGRVVRVEGGSGLGPVGESGMAYRFVQPDSQAFEDLTRLVSSL